MIVSTNINVDDMDNVECRWNEHDILTVGCVGMMNEYDTDW